MKDPIRKKIRGNALVEFVVISPLIVLLLLITAQLFNILLVKNKLIKATRYMAWEKEDSTGGTGGQEKRSSADIIASAKDFYELDDANIETMALSDHDSVELGNFDTVSFTGILADLSSSLVYLSVQNLGLSTKGLWQAEISYRVPFPGADAINQIVPGEDLENSLVISEECWLLTDPWIASNNPGSSVTSGQVRDRLSGYWLIGPLDFTGGWVTEMITEILNFHISLPWPFDDFYLCREQPPRVNLSSVPEPP